MPNGEDKNWIRCCAALDGFFVRYGHWPTRLRITRGALEDFRHLFYPEVLHRFLSQFEVIVDDRFFAAESDGGRRYDYGVEGFPPHRPRVSAAEYFGVRPGSPEVGDRLHRVVNLSTRYDLIIAGRVLRWLEPMEVVREVIRSLLLEFRWSAERVNDRAGKFLLTELDDAPRAERRAVAREATGNPRVLLDSNGHSFLFTQERDWSDYVELLYRFDAELPVGMVQWRESLFLRKADIAQRLQLSSLLGPRVHRYVPPSSTRGPLANSYRVGEVSLFAGECPRNEEDLAALRDGGIDCIVDLRSGDEPGERFTSGKDGRAEYHRHPIEPGRLPTRDALELTLDTIEDSLARGKVVYVHDLGGLGRTSLVLACLLTRWGLTPLEALNEITRLAQTMPKAAGRPIPETVDQRNFVLQWTDR